MEAERAFDSEGAVKSEEVNGRREKQSMDVLRRKRLRRSVMGERESVSMLTGIWKEHHLLGVDRVRVFPSLRQSEWLTNTRVDVSGMRGLVGVSGGKRGSG